MLNKLSPVRYQAIAWISVELSSIEPSGEISINIIILFQNDVFQMWSAEDILKISLFVQAPVW